MTAEAFSSHLPQPLTLDDVALMAEADPYSRFYELSPTGVLSVMTPPGLSHAQVATRLMLWFGEHGYREVFQNLGIRTETSEGTGARIPDLSVWNPTPTAYPVWVPVDGLLVAVEILSRSTELTDRIEKREEYAAAGITRYWIVGRDKANTVTMLVLQDGKYEEVEGSPRPLSWLLNTTPQQHLR
ncbi:hypothetical protein Val02_68340 [Virgisporangium aliadipatigenens]|uniref:Putative restriction endonuclease domain-containing protein n=1 Tax=Virgisporangium aliadipatigenens TaxID=741659 RepID=A0A8J4DUD5_9ACTN|nr:Uma2 family endonuclease [Virgisporangium aliadipatigenens]GIJ49948.1 hypothetical protein Val02_68340 [Virgisporangium aliadipatigenens]